MSSISKDNRFASQPRIFPERQARIGSVIDTNLNPELDSKDESPSKKGGAHFRDGTNQG